MAPEHLTTTRDTQEMFFEATVTADDGDEEHFSPRLSRDGAWPDDLIRSLERLLRAYADAANCAPNAARGASRRTRAGREARNARAGSSDSRRAAPQYADQIADPA